jgi:hypothetical protein
MTRAQRSSAGIALGVFCLALVGATLKPSGPAWSVFGNALWVGLPFLGLFLAYGMRPLSALAELGLRGSPRDALAVALLSSAPMVATFALTCRLNSHISWTHLLLIAAIAPVAEEVLFRGYFFQQLYRRAGWSLWSAVGVSAALFGLIHAHHVFGQGGARLLAEVAITAAGGAFFAWLLVQWSHNLWVPIGAHAAMNFWWEVFDVDSTAIGTRAGNVGRFLFIGTAVAMTIHRTIRRRRAAAIPLAGVQAEGP